MQNNYEGGEKAGPALTSYLAWRDQSEFWSDFGYDGLSVVFDVPLDSLHALPEAKKRALFRLMVFLADTPQDSLHGQVQALGAQPEEQRLAVLGDLSARFVD